MYAGTSFRGAKMCKIGKKGVFLAILTNFEKDMADKLRKNACKNTFLGCILIPLQLGYVLKVLLRG